jgi:hypothetical protein
MGQGDPTALFGEGMYLQLNADGAGARHDPGSVSYLSACLPLLNPLILLEVSKCFDSTLFCMFVCKNHDCDWFNFLVSSSFQSHYNSEWKMCLFNVELFVFTLELL